MLGKGDPPERSRTSPPDIQQAAAREGLWFPCLCELPLTALADPGEACASKLARARAKRALAYLQLHEREGADSKQMKQHSDLVHVQKGSTGSELWTHALGMRQRSAARAAVHHSDHPISWHVHLHFQSR